MRKVRGLLAVEAHREIIDRERLEQNRDQLAVATRDRGFVAHVV
jgi:hypothetical protein